MPRQPKTKQKQARRFSAARLIVVCAFALCAGILLFQGVEYALSFRRQSTRLSASAGEAVRTFQEENEDRININTATEAELRSVSGVGPEMARRILALREERGGYHFLEELKDVSGIGDKRFDALKEYFFCPLPEDQQTERENDCSF